MERVKTSAAPAALSAVVGIAVAMALVRGIARRRTEQLGNFWLGVDERLDSQAPVE